ncbi:DDE-type integrase/transposase/recombinase [Nonomuraea phyllanthi]|nr:DDE-type integrase/transposase/recombinase [Nonomuraea phyllanthi]
MLLAVSGNGPQMTSSATRTFMAGARIAQHVGRPGTPHDQAWIESLFGHARTGSRIEDADGKQDRTPQDPRWSDERVPPSRTARRKSPGSNHEREY